MGPAGDAVSVHIPVIGISINGNLPQTHTEQESDEKINYFGALMKNADN